MNFFWLFHCFPQFRIWMLSEPCNSENHFRKSKIIMHWQLPKIWNHFQPSIHFVDLQNFFEKREMPKSQQQQKIDLQMWYRNCFGLFYITVRHTLPNVCFLQSVLTSSPATASKQIARCAGGDCVGCSLFSLPFCQTSPCTLWLGRVRNHLSKTSDKHKLSDSWFCSQYGQYPFLKLLCLHNY